MNSTRIFMVIMLVLGSFHYYTTYAVDQKNLTPEQMKLYDEVEKKHKAFLDAKAKSVTPAEHRRLFLGYVKALQEMQKSKAVLPKK